MQPQPDICFVSCRVAAAAVGDPLGFSLVPWLLVGLIEATHTLHTHFILKAGLLHTYISWVTVPSTLARGHKDGAPAFYMLGIMSQKW
jgi:hypothetical protein